ncbi:DNA polymerase eta [Tanacetum coccineum]
MCLSKIGAAEVLSSMRGDEAKEVCPKNHLVQVPVVRDKADLTIYREGSEVVSILARKGRCDSASIDEVYLHLTDAAERMFKEIPLESLESLGENVLKSLG